MPSLCRALRLALVLSTLWPSTTVADSFLSDTIIRKRQVQNVLEYQPVKISECQNTSPTGPIDATMCDYETVESVNEKLFNNLSELVKMPFFKYFQVDLYRECPFWPDDGSCSDPGCAITSVDESEIPERWRAAALSKVTPVADDRHQLSGCYYRDSDFCFLDDHTEGEYYDLSIIPERYTGYAGPDAHRIWRSIYEENCFDISETTGKSTPPAADGLRADGVGSDTCLEKKVYYRVVSGLHASISTHICLEFLNQTTGDWSPNLQCYVNRVAAHPERLQNIYFNTVLLLRAVARLGPYLSAYDYCSTGTHEDDEETKSKLDQVISIAQRAGRFDETVLFQGADADLLKEEFKTHFRNVTRIMDCIGCDKCRLWGKVQTTGVATALKILFELDESALDPHTNSNLLQRSEVVALINTLHRFSESLEAANEFRHMWSEISAKESEDIILEAEKATNPVQPPSPSPGRERADNLLGEARMRFAVLFRVCRESTVVCMAMLLDLWTKWAEIVGSVFKPSGKENGPGFGDL